MRILNNQSNNIVKTDNFQVQLCLAFMSSIYVKHLCQAFISSIYVKHLCQAFMSRIYVKDLCQGFMSSIYVSKKIAKMVNF